MVEDNPLFVGRLVERTVRGRYRIEGHVTPGDADQKVQQRSQEAIPRFVQLGPVTEHEGETSCHLVRVKQSTLFFKMKAIGALDFWMVGGDGYETRF